MTLQRKLFMLVVILALTIGGMGAGVLGGTTTGGQVRLLVIDETHSVQSSLQIELFARALVGTGEFYIRAMTDVPADRNPGAPYDIAVIVPTIVPQVWVVTPDLPDRLPPALVRALYVVSSTADKLYEGSRSLDPRAVVGVTDDLFPAVYSGFLVRNGWL